MAGSEQEHRDGPEDGGIVRLSRLGFADPGDVIDGSFKIFSSAHGEIRPEALLASAAIPNLFPAVQVNGHAYWDGIFASNPPVRAAITPSPASR